MRGWLAAVSLGLIFVLLGCATHRPVTWEENGQRLGTIYEDALPDGTLRKRYVDTSGRLARLEHFDHDRRPVAGMFATIFIYDPAVPSRIVEIRYLDAAGNLVTNERGYASARIHVAGPTREETYFDTDGRPVGRSDGVHRLVDTCDGEEAKCCTRREYRDLHDRLAPSCGGYTVRLASCHADQLTEIRFLDAAGKPITATYRGTATARVRYEYLKGVKSKAITAEHYLDEAGGTVTSRFYLEPLRTAFDDCR